MGLDWVDCCILFGNMDFNADVELPASHLEGMEESAAKDAEQVARNCYERQVADNPGLLAEWSRIAAAAEAPAGERPPGAAESNLHLDEFSADYQAYVGDAGGLYRNDPESYRFFRDQIFDGKDYIDVWEGRQIDRAVEIARGAFTPEMWNGLSAGERIDAIVAAEAVFAEIAGVPAPAVATAELPSGVLLLIEDGAVYVDPEAATQLEPLEAAAAAYRASVYLYQEQAAADSGFHPRENEAALWRANLVPDAYLPPDLYGPEIWAGQPAEEYATARESRFREAFATA